MSAHGRNEIMTSGYYQSPIGWIKMTADGNWLSSIGFVDTLPEFHFHDENPVISDAMAQLDSYFNNPRHEFQLPLAPPATEFQALARGEMLNIPTGQIKSYQEIANSLHRPGASRAVGRAAATNPFLIVVPCHRVVGSGGKLTGYAGGMNRKKWLLEHEAIFSLK
ncbi:MAG: methylated-DNA--[protein]-cysteine S-methyltransferase [Isosphaeraceae bacterium]